MKEMLYVNHKTKGGLHQTTFSLINRLEDGRTI